MHYLYALILGALSASAFARNPLSENYPIFLGVDDLPAFYQAHAEDQPRIGLQTEVYLGDVLLSQKKGFYLPCIKSTFDHSEKIFGGTMAFIKSGGLLCPQLEQVTVVKPLPLAGLIPVGYANSDYPERPQVTIAFKEKKDYYLIEFGARTLDKRLYKNEISTLFEYSPFYVIYPDKVQRTIEYMGKSGSVANFVYAEYVDPGRKVSLERNFIPRPSYTREFKVDLSEGNIGGFRGALFEIHNATNATIQYTVIRHFPE